MTDKELDEKHNENCDFIYKAIGTLDLNHCVNWDKVQSSPTDDVNKYQLAYYHKKKVKNG